MRVAGPRLRPVDVPVVVTIKGAVPETLFLAVLVSLIGALGPFSSKPENLDEEQLNTKQTRRALGWLPVLSGIAAGVLAAFVIYLDDPTWGAERGPDTLKLVVAAYAASTAGLAATAAPTKALRGRLARK